METDEPLEEQLGRYEDKWVAILESEQRVVGSGDNAYDAKVNAEANGYPETTLLKVPRFDTVYVLNA